jgi:hypothetical protein
MMRIIKSCSKGETGWDQALALYRKQLRFYLDCLIQCCCGEEIVAKVDAEVRDSDVPDDFKLPYLVRTLVRSVILHMDDCNRTTKDSGCLPSGSPNSLPTLPAQEGMVYFLRDILKYSKRDTSLLIEITDAEADRLLSLARKRIDMTEGPSSTSRTKPSYMTWPQPLQYSVGSD